MDIIFKKIADIALEYAHHSALNFGQAVQGVRYFYSHPRFDAFAKKGSLKHFRYSFPLRCKLIANDLFFALIPPHWHHSKQELLSLHRFSISIWFEAGHAPWRFIDESLTRRVLTGNEDKRWDPRCDE